ncbi:MAG: hypothetical protein VXV98_09070, partial [Candidatus Thermoplasmatota archaeon]|nr:hypothetical protein [Candidatus Thermoplasmatota archaeon]
GDSATITNIANSVLTAKAITNTTLVGDSATITNIANSTFTGKVITGTNVAFDSARIGSIGIGGTDITTSGKIYYANIFSNLSDLPDANSHHGMFAHVHATGGGYFAHGGAWHRLIDSSTTAIQRVRALLSDSATINNLAVGTLNIDAINIGDSATFTNIATTQITGSQATLDSATITKLNVDSADIDHFSTENINFDSATGDSATITNIANSVLTAKAITNTTLVGDSATITNIANSVLTAKAITNTTQVGDSATITNIANSVLTAKAITGTTVTTSGDIVSSGTIRVGNLNVDSADIIKISRDNLASGTGVTYDSSTGNISIGQPVGTSDSVTFSGLTIGGNLVVSGTTSTVATTNTTLTDQLFELGNGRTGSPSGDAGIVIEMGNDSNAFMGFDQSLGKFVVSRTNATGSSTGNLVHTTAPLVVGGLTADSIGGTLQTAAQTNVTSLGTLTALTVDNTAIDGDTISNSTSNDMLFDAGGGIILDADDNGTISFRDGGTRYGVVEKSSNDFNIQSMINDGDVKILGKDGSTTITALTLDMSEAGKAIFNNEAVIPKIDADSA